MKVQFTGSDNVVQNTPYQPCPAGLSMNLYLAGLRAKTQYSVKHIVDTGDAFVNGPPISLTTGEARSDLPAQTVQLQSPTTPSGILLQATIASNPMAVDMSGNVIWYYPGELDFNQVGVKALDDHTLQVKLKSPTAYFLFLAGYYPLFATIT